MKVLIEPCYKFDILKMLTKFWNNPVWSKVIAGIILIILPVIYAKIKSITDEITFMSALHGLINIRIKLIYIVGIFVLLLIIRQINKKNKQGYSKKQRELQKFSMQRHDAEGVLLKWKVLFEDELPYISNLTAFCTKHNEVPIRFVDNICPIQGCTNSKQPLHMPGVQNILESELIARWDKIK